MGTSCPAGSCLATIRQIQNIDNAVLIEIRPWVVSRLPSFFPEIPFQDRDVGAR